MREGLMALMAGVALFGLVGVGEAQDYPCTGSIFSDVNASSPDPFFCGFIEEFGELGITSGCRADDPLTPGNEAMYCPGGNVTRAQMAVFITRVLARVPRAPGLLERANTINTVDGAGADVGCDTSITIGMDGFPVISYRDVTNGDLKVAKCANQFCLNNWWRR